MVSSPSSAAWRIVSAARVEHAFDGEGARLYGGRWNTPGRPMIYTSGSRALAALEIRVHINIRRHVILFKRFHVQIPETLVQTLNTTALPADFGLTCGISPETQILGDTWLDAGSSAVLRVPSAIIPEEPNYLINPLHPAFAKIRIAAAEDFAFDPRLLKG